MRKYYTLAVLGVILGILFGVISACGFSGDQRTDPSYRTLRYEGGDFSGSKFKECMGDGEKIASNDKFYSYPTTQREDVWDSNNFEAGNKSADNTDLVLTDKNGVTVNAKVKVDFFLNTSCEPVTVDGKEYKGGTLQAFHELIGKTRGAYFNVGKSGTNAYSSGWIWAMTNYISNPLENQLNVEARQTTADAMWLDSAEKTKMENELEAKLPALINAGMETDLDFYKIANIQITSLTPGDDYLDLFKKRQTAKIDAQTAQINKHSRVVGAEADAAVKCADVLGYRLSGMSYTDAVNAYLKAKAIEAGMNPFQPNVNSIQTGQ